MGVGGEASAVVLITLLGILGNAVVVVTLLRRSLLHHPSNRLVLSLTASNLVLALVVLPGMVASLVLASSPNTTANTDSASPTRHLANLNTTDIDSNTTNTHSNTISDTDIGAISDTDIGAISNTDFGANSNTISANTTTNTTSINTIKNPRTKKISLTPSDQQFNTNKKEIYRDVTKPKHISRQNKSRGGDDGDEPSTSPSLKSDDSDKMTTDNDDSDDDNDENDDDGDDLQLPGGGISGGGGGSKLEMGSERLCQGAAFFANFVTSASAITVAVIALDRYLAIVRPMVYGLMVTGNRCLVMLAWCWVQAALTALPPLLGWARYEHRGPEGRCGVAWSSSPSYTAVWALSVFLIPVIIMLVSYYFILQVARNKCRRIHVGKVLGASASSPPVTPDPSSSMCLDGPALTDLLPSTPGIINNPRDLIQMNSNTRDLVNSYLMQSELARNSSEITKTTGDFTPTQTDNPPVFPILSNGLPHKYNVGNGLLNGVANGHDAGQSLGSKSSLRNLLGSDSKNGLRGLLGNGTGSIAGSGKLGGNGASGIAPNTLEGYSRSLTGMNKINDIARLNLAPKRKLADCGRSLSFSQQQTQCVRPCLRRAQSSLSVRPATIRKKFSLAARKPSWSWEASPAKGFRTVCVVVGTHVMTWAPYTALAVAEAALGPHRAHLIPQWASVTATLLLFSAGVFYPIVYGLYNRSIRKEVVACVCPGSSRDRRRGSCHRRASTLHSNTGSVLDFSSLRHRDDDIQQLRHQESVSALGILGNSGQIKTISGALAAPALPALPPLFQLSEYAGLPTRGYDINARKQSQDSGAVMSSVDDPDSDLETPSLTIQHNTGRRVSAPSILDTVTEHPHTPEVIFHIGSRSSSSASSSSSSSSRSRSPLAQRRKLPIVPLSPQIVRCTRRKVRGQRSRSLEKLPQEDSRVETERLLVNRVISQSLRKKNTVPPKEQFSQSCSERTPRRKGSISMLKVVAIPEDSGIGECSEVPDSGRGSVDSGEVTKTRAHPQVSIDEGIGAECLVEEEAITRV